MIIIGVGCGPDLITVEAIKVLEKSEDVYGAKRAIDLALPYLPPNCHQHVLKDFSKVSSLPENAVLLSTGDPMLSGL